MSHTLPYFSKSILEEPQLASPGLFKSVAEYLDNRNTGMFSGESFEQPDKKIRVKNGVAYLPIQGVLVDKPDMMSNLCGMTSYRKLTQDVESLCNDPAVNKIVMTISSGGGSAFNCINTAYRLRELCSASNTQLIAYVENACSAAYALASSANIIVAHQDSTSGSVGCVCSLEHDNVKAKNDGITRLFISSADSKTPFNKDLEFRSDFISDLQKRINALALNFCTLVSEMRNIPLAQVQAQKAKVYGSTDAKARGLIDKIMTPEEFASWLNTTQQPVTSSLPSNFKAENKSYFGSAENLKLEQLVKAKLSETAQDKKAAILAQLKQLNQQ